MNNLSELQGNLVKALTEVGYTEWKEAHRHISFVTDDEVSICAAAMIGGTMIQSNTIQVVFDTDWKIPQDAIVLFKTKEGTGKMFAIVLKNSIDNANFIFFYDNEPF